MRVVVVVEARYTRTPDGCTWTYCPPARSFWDRYLAVFDEVRVVARVLDVAQPPERAIRVDGPRVSVWPVPYYVGLSQYLARWRAVRAAVRAAAAPEDAVIVRAPSLLGPALLASRRGLPYALEVVGDPAGVFARGVVDHPLRPLLRWWFSKRLRSQCRHAEAVAYVTGNVLQRAYPAGPRAVTASYSSVELPDTAYRPLPRSWTDPPAEPVVVSIGSLDQLYKGIDTLIDAVALLHADGIKVRHIHIGDGRYRTRLERIAAERDLAAWTCFAGALPAGPAVQRQLDAADLFVLPSRAEGQGRALIEAMARALPAIGSTVGGTPELLGPSHLVAPDEPAELAACAGRLLRSPAELSSASARNLLVARCFSAGVLMPRRTAFYHAVAEATRSAVPTLPALRGDSAGRRV